MPVKVIAGLGNPGSKYEKTRHNAGFIVVDAFAESLSGQWAPDRAVRHAVTTKVTIGDQSIVLLKPMDFMNRSGRVLQSYCRYFRIHPSELVVIYDDITLDPGRVKISTQGGDGGHNGVADILGCLGNGFIRFRIGIGPKNNPEMDLADYVLGQLPKEHHQLLLDNMQTYWNGLISLVEQGPILTMNQFNQNRTQDECNGNTTL